MTIVINEPPQLRISNLERQANTHVFINGVGKLLQTAITPMLYPTSFKVLQVEYVRKDSVRQK
jgi:hypothetical protein